jgi:hypothetical protein
MGIFHFYVSSPEGIFHGFSRFCPCFQGEKRHPPLFHSKTESARSRPRLLVNLWENRWFPVDFPLNQSIAYDICKFITTYPCINTIQHMWVSLLCISSEFIISANEDAAAAWWADEGWSRREEQVRRRALEVQMSWEVEQSVDLCSWLEGIWMVAKMSDRCCMILYAFVGFVSD